MNTYYLIARSRKDDSFTVLKLKETWYKGREKGREDVLTRANDLEAIDLVTTRFASEEAMAERMAMNGYIPDSDVDIFIANKTDVDGKCYIRFDEAIYGGDKKDRVDALRRVALTSLAGDFKNDQFDLNNIYADLIQTAYICDDYLMMLIDGDMNVPTTFTQKLSKIQSYEDVPLALKDDDEFGADDYLTVRNIVESLNRLEHISGTIRDDRCAANDSFIGRNIGGRMAIMGQLAEVLDESYVEGQLSLFTYLEEEEKRKREEAASIVAKEVVEEKKVISGKIEIKRDLSDYDKRKEVFRVLRRLPRNVFYKEKSTGDYKVNFDIFGNYPPTEDEQRRLSTYLFGKTKPGNLPKYFAHYIRDYGLLTDAQRDGFTPPSEMSELQTDVEYDVIRIDNRFKSARCLNMAYEWAMLMEGAIKRDKEIGEGAVIMSSDTNEAGKTYAKK